MKFDAQLFIVPNKTQINQKYNEFIYSNYFLYNNGNTSYSFEIYGFKCVVFPLEMFVVVVLVKINKHLVVTYDESCVVVFFL